MKPFCEAWANKGKTVLVAALDGTYQRKGFMNILELIPFAEHVIKLTAVCIACFGEAPYTKRISNDTEVNKILISNSAFINIHLIGGSNRWRRQVYGSLQNVLPLERVLSFQSSHSVARLEQSKSNGRSST